MEAFWLALVLVLLIEGAGPLLFPNKWRLYLFKLSQESAANLRQVGAVLCAGALLIYLFLL